ncbi:MAG: prolyl oligopeptidase family serine peptidase [Bacilli bacterium]|nr:prolyl oligopeptidase family serine peptidase [Bacilli bacterium]
MKKAISLLPLLFICASISACGSSNQNNNPTIKIEDGKCQPIYLNNRPFAEHDAKISNIARFTVYIETDYDTDLDGNNDLAKAFIQLPKAVLENNYKVASIIEFSPYTASQTDLDTEDLMEGKAPVSDEELYQKGKTRQKTSEIDLLSHNNSIDKSEFCYTVGDDEKTLFYEDAKDCDYFITRGFAFINMGGYGTLGSDGIETVGAALENHAYACLIDWLNGERVAFSDYEGTHTVKASFSNGNYGAQGASYLGTAAYQLACMGLKGLKAIVPTAGIASWYEYTNSQGTAQVTSPNCSWLSLYCSSRFYDENLSDDFINRYGGYLRNMNEEELNANGDYTSFWAKRDYTTNVKPSCPALIIHGMNDFNVPVRNATLMYQTFKSAGQNAKLVLHQGDHLAMYNNDYAYSIDDYKESFFEVINRWYSHYLYGVDNGIENFPDLTYQSNVDGLFYSDKSILDGEKKIINLSNPSRDTITSKDMKFYYVEWNDAYYDRDDNNSISFNLGKAENTMQINGIPEINLHLKTKDIGRDNLQVSAVLLDTYEEDFPAFGAYDFYPTEKKLHDQKFDLYTGKQGYYRCLLQEETKAKMITYTTFDLYNPGAHAYGEQLPRTELEADKTYEYQAYFEPTTYTLEKGHTLKCILFTFDPGLTTKQGWLADEEDEEYNPAGDVFFTPDSWTTTDYYGYTLDMSVAPTLSLPN